MEKFNWKYVLYGVAAIFIVLIVYELASKKDSEPEKVSEAVMKSPLDEKSVHQQQPEKPVRMTPSKTQVSGPLHGYFEVVDRNYKVTGGKMHVELKRVKEGFPAPWNDEMELGYSEQCFEPGFYVEYLDSDGDIVSKDATSIIYDKQELRSIAELNIDESAAITFSATSSDATSFRMGSSFIVHEPAPMQETANETAAQESSTSSTTLSASRQQSGTSTKSTDIENGDDDNNNDNSYNNNDEYDDDDTYYDDDDESTWQKVKKKSKRVYRKAKQKFRRWLDK